MLPKDIPAIISDLSLLEEVTTESLEELVGSYPYFGAARVLLLKKYQITDMSRFSNYLPVVATYVGNRTHLREFLEMPVPVKTLPGPELETDQAQPEIKDKVEEPETEPVVLEKPSETNDAITIHDIEPVGTEPEEQEAEDKTASADANSEMRTFTEWLHLLDGTESKIPIQPTVREPEDEISDPDKTIDELPELPHDLDEPVSDDLIDPVFVSELQYQAELIREIRNTGEEETIPETKPSLLEDHINEEELKAIEKHAGTSLQADDEAISETLASLLSIQGKRDQAVNMYHKLILKYPEKSAFFASRIEEIKKNK